jgi:hypothetical protein
LIDGGVSHNFIDAALLQRRHIPTVEFEGFKVEVAEVAPCLVTGTFQGLLRFKLLLEFFAFH